MPETNVQTVPWSAGVWTNPPAATKQTPLGLTVQAIRGSDVWTDPRTGEPTRSENALLCELHPGQGMEVAFIADMTEQFDQAGVFIAAEDGTWAKAGMELADGLLQLSATVTRERSDRSMCWLPDWNGRPVRIRISWKDSTIAVRASVDGDPFQLVRVFSLSEDQSVSAGPYLASPHRQGLSITFTDWAITDADAYLS